MMILHIFRGYRMKVLDMITGRCQYVHMLVQISVYAPLLQISSDIDLSMFLVVLLFSSLDGSFGTANGDCLL